MYKSCTAVASVGVGVLSAGRHGRTPVTSRTTLLLAHTPYEGLGTQASVEAQREGRRGCHLLSAMYTAVLLKFTTFGFHLVSPGFIFVSPSLGAPSQHTRCDLPRLT